MFRFMRVYFSPEGAQGGSGNQAQAGQQAQAAQQTQQQAQQPAAGQVTTPTIDYDKIQQMLDGTLAAKENTALKAYFSQQGLSQQEAEQAIAAFKAEKAKNTPDVGALQAQVAQSQSAVQQAQIQASATMAAVELGIDVKAIPYVLKMADFSQVIGQDGKLNEETMKNAINTVLEAIPALKPQAAAANGFVQVGASAQQNTQNAVDEDLDRIFGVKKK